MFKYGSKEQQSSLLKKFDGKVKFFATHKSAAPVLEFAFANTCNARERASITQEFYGPEFGLFKDNIMKFAEILEKHPEKKKSVMSNLREFVMLIGNKPTSLDNSVVHLPILNYMQTADYSGKLEAVGSLCEHIVRFLHTKHGARLAVLCVKYATAKERKVIVKSCKDYLTKIAKEEYGHFAFLEILASVDDTVLVKRELLSKIEENLLDLCTDKHGRLCVLALIASPDTRYFPESTVKLLGPVAYNDPANPGQEIMTSKKEKSKRQAENYNNFKDMLTKFCIENCYALWTDVYGRTVICEFLLKCEDPEIQKKIITETLKWINFDEASFHEREKAAAEPTRKYHPLEEQPAEVEPKQDLMNHTLSSRMLKQVVRELPGFDQILFDHIKDQVVTYVQHKSAAWVIFSLFDTNTVGPQVKELLKGKKFSIPEGHEGYAVVLAALTQGGEEEKMDIDK